MALPSQASEKTPHKFEQKTNLKIIENKYTKTLVPMPAGDSVGLFLYGLPDHGSGTLDTRPNRLFFKPCHSKGLSKRPFKASVLRTLIILV